MNVALLGTNQDEGFFRIRDTSLLVNIEMTSLPTIVIIFPENATGLPLELQIC